MVNGIQEQLEYSKRVLVQYLLQRLYKSEISSIIIALTNCVASYISVPPYIIKEE